MNRKFLAVARPICRMIASLLWQLVWLLPFEGICLYLRIRIPTIINAHFGVDQLQDRLVSLEHFADYMKATSSISNPSAMFQYLSAQINKLAVSTRLHTVQMTADVIQSICLWGLSLLMICGVIYAVIRAFRQYRAKSEIYETAITIEKTLSAEFRSLHAEIEKLQQQIAHLQQNYLPEGEKDVPQLPKK